MMSIGTKEEQKATRLVDNHRLGGEPSADIFREDVIGEVEPPGFVDFSQLQQSSLTLRRDTRHDVWEQQGAALDLEVSEVAYGFDHAIWGNRGICRTRDCVCPGTEG